jgi:hypothetical protein
MRVALLLIIALAGCGSPTLAGPCEMTCDCPNIAAPEKCAGEWICNAAQTCEYACKSACDPTSVFTCRSEEDCLGNICSERKACR